MIKFFRQIRYRLIETGQGSKYLKYAVGEIFLVVNGILIALQINNWNTGKIKKADERKILIELKKGLELDRDKIEVELAACKVALEKMKKLKILLKDQDYSYNENLDSLFGQVYGIRKIFLNKAFYEDLKSSSLRIINNDEIRLQIIQLFELNYSVLNDIFYYAEPSVNEVIRPYYLSNFRDIDFKDKATPNYFNEIWNDTYYHNIVDYRIIGVTSNQIREYEKVLPRIKHIIVAIDGYLKL